jgi:hypothetical protein
MIKPTININGTSKDDLINPRRDAMDALASVVEILKLVTPNGRDYPRDLSQCVADRDKHHARLNQLRDIQNELLQEALYIQREA